MRKKKKSLSEKRDENAISEEARSVDSKIKPQHALSLTLSVRGVAATDMDRNDDMSERSNTASNKPQGPESRSMSFHSELVHRHFGATHRIDKKTIRENIALREFVALCADIKKYRNTLKKEDKSEFDHLWGLDADGYFPTETMSFMSKFRLTKSKRNIKYMVLADLEHVLQSTEREQEMLLSEKERETSLRSKMEMSGGDKYLVRDDDEKCSAMVEKRLLFLFQCDLLPGLQGKVLEAKGQRDFFRPRVIAWHWKMVGWVLTALLDGGMLFYITLFALQQSTARQSAWFQSFVLWLVSEVFVVSTLSMLTTHVVIPSLVMGDVRKLKSKIVEQINDFQKKLHKAHDDSQNGLDSDGNGHANGFNAAKYLYVSHRLASKYSHLKVAKVVQSYRTVWPRQSYQHEVNETKSYVGSLLGVRRAAVVLVLILLFQVVSIPVSFQDAMIEMVVSVAVGYVLYWHLSLFAIYPALAFLPLLLLLIVIHFAIVTNRRHPPPAVSHSQTLQQQSSSEYDEVLSEKRAKKLRFYSGPRHLSDGVQGFDYDDSFASSSEQVSHRINEGKRAAEVENAPLNAEMQSNPQFVQRAPTRTLSLKNRSLALDDIGEGGSCSPFLVRKKSTTFQANEKPTFRKSGSMKLEDFNLASSSFKKHMKTGSSDEAVESVSHLSPPVVKKPPPRSTDIEDHPSIYTHASKRTIPSADELPPISMSRKHANDRSCKEYSLAGSESQSSNSSEALLPSPALLKTTKPIVAPTTRKPNNTSTLPNINSSKTGGVTRSSFDVDDIVVKQVMPKFSDIDSLFDEPIEHAHDHKHRREEKKHSHHSQGHHKMSLKDQNELYRSRYSSDHSHKDVDLHVQNIYEAEHKETSVIQKESATKSIRKKVSVLQVSELDDDNNDVNLIDDNTVIGVLDSDSSPKQSPVLKATQEDENTFVHEVEDGVLLDESLLKHRMEISVKDPTEMLHWKNNFF